MPNPHRKNRWRITGAAHVIGFALASLALVIFSTAMLAANMQAIESDRLSPKSYEIQTKLNRDISSAIGYGMSVFFESLSKKRKSYALECVGKLRETLFDISLITDKTLDKTASESANRSWEEVRRLVNSADSSCDALNKELAKARPNWKKVHSLSQSVADTLMETSDPQRAVMDNDK